MGAAPMKIMSAAPTYYPSGMGGLLSTLTLGLIKDKPKQQKLSQAEIMSQMALVVTNKLAAQCMTADVGKIRESAGYNLNNYAAWEQVITDGAVVDQITNKVIADLLGSRLVVYAPGCANGGQVVEPYTVPTPASNSVVIPSQLPPINPALIAGGIGFAALLLIRKRRRGRR